MPVAYQSRAVTEPQREVARRSCDGGTVGTSYIQFSSRLSAGRGLLQGLVSTPTRRGPTFVCAKVGKTHLGLRPKTP